MIEWIKQNYDVVFGIIGALYMAARGIAFLTPTPKDDIYVTKIGVFLKRIGKAFGLDLTQGFNRKS